jgi:ABC-type Zn uptake system ZnuABC Zn-binding protein ZnuA
MRRLLLFGVLGLAAAAASAGCGRDRGRAGSGRPGVVATVLPVYVLALDVAGENPGVELSLLLPAGSGCPHDYALSPGDVARLARARLLLANGAGFEAFLTRETLAAANKDLKVAELSANLALIPREPEAGGEEGAGHHHHEGAFNPHTFASPRNAAKMTRRIAEELAALDPAGAAAYRRNAEESARRLEALADELAAAAKDFPNRKVVAMHDVFAYLARDAGLEVVGVIEEEPGQEPGMGTFAKLVKRTRAEKPAAILSEPQYSDRPAQALSRETGVPVFPLDPFASGRAERGAYLAAMRGNLATLRKALGPPGAPPGKSP